MRMTITEAMAEIATIDKRVAKKHEFIYNNLLRADALRDPFAKDGGQAVQVARETQAIIDLQDRKVDIRMAIAAANVVTKLTIDGVTLSVAEWLVWRRESAPVVQAHLQRMAQIIQSQRAQAQQRGFAVVTTADMATKPQDLIVNVDERKLADDIESMETTLGALDGQLSLLNATTFVEFD